MAIGTRDARPLMLGPGRGSSGCLRGALGRLGGSWRGRCAQHRAVYPAARRLHEPHGRRAPLGDDRRGIWRGRREGRPVIAAARLPREPRLRVAPHADNRGRGHKLGRLISVNVLQLRVVRPVAGVVLCRDHHVRGWPRRLGSLGRSRHSGAKQHVEQARGASAACGWKRCT
jgi:hypothetical protein